MRRFRMCGCSVALATFMVLPIFAKPAAQRRFPVTLGNTATAVQRRTFSVKGWVAEGQSHRRIESVRVELHTITGTIVGETFTGANGDFEFDNIPPGTYTLVAVPMEYESVTQQIQVLYGPLWGLEVELHKPDETVGGSQEGGKVSVRELSIPHKAQDAMQKGMDLLYRKSDYRGSIKQFQSAVQAYPDYYEAYAQIGVAYRELGDSPSSEQALRKSVELSREQYLDGLCLLAALLSDNGRFSEAEPVARKSVELDPDSWQANAALAKTLLGLNRGKEAEANAATAVKLQPGNPTLHLILANIHIRLRNYAGLLDDLNAYLKLDPSGPMADQARTQRAEIESILGATHVSSVTTLIPDR